MIFSKQPMTYGAIALTSLVYWGSHVKPNHAHQIKMVASQPLIASTSSEHNVFKAVNELNLPSSEEYSKYAPNNDSLIEASPKNAVLANTDLRRADIARGSLTRKNLEKINLRNIIMLEIVIIASIVAYTYIRLPK